MSKSIPADRGGNVQADVLDDGTLQNWVLLAHQIVDYAANDYIAAAYPDCAGGYVRNWLAEDFRNLQNNTERAQARRELIIQARLSDLDDYWKDGGGEFAEFAGYNGLAEKLKRIVHSTLTGNAKSNLKSTIRRAFEAYAYGKRTGRERKEKCYEKKKCANPKCTAEVCPESTYCKRCAAIRREHNRLTKKRGIIRAEA